MGCETHVACCTVMTYLILCSDQRRAEVWMQLAVVHFTFWIL